MEVAKLAPRGHGMEPRSAMVLCWIITVGLAEVAYLGAPWLVAVPAILAAIVVPAVVVGGPASGRVWSGLFLLSAAVVPFAPLAGWIVGAIGAVIALSHRAPLRGGDSVADMRREIERSRRAETPAAVFVANVADGKGVDAQHIRGTFRLADTVEVVHDAAGFHLRGVVNDLAEFCPFGLGERLELELGTTVETGWARFPDEGMTLEALLERATADLHATDAAPTRPETASLPTVAPDYALAATGS
jgi:hypothetical protein